MAALCANFFPAPLFQQPSISASFPDPHYFVPETMLWVAISPYLCFCSDKEICPPQLVVEDWWLHWRWVHRLVELTCHPHLLTFIYCSFHDGLSFWCLFCVGSEQQPGAWHVLLHRTVCHVPEDLGLLLQQEEDLLILLLKLFCGGEQKTEMKKIKALARKLSDSRDTGPI